LSKDRKLKFIKFTPAFLKILEAAHEEATSITIAYLQKKCFELTNVKHEVDFEQSAKLFALLQTKDAERGNISVHEHLAVRWLRDGVLLSTLTNLEELLSRLDVIFRSLERGFDAV
jgi:hypothetical protein